MCYRPAEAKDLCSKMLGHRLITKQTRPEGVLVRKVMIAESVNLKRELYFALLMDRTFNGPVMVASPKGGVDIEQVAEETPHLIFKVYRAGKKGKMSFSNRSKFPSQRNPLTLKPVLNRNKPVDWPKNLVLTPKKRFSKLRKRWRIYIRYS